MTKTKTITCDKCNGRGYFTYERYGADYAGINVLRCEACRGIGAVVVPVTNADHIRSMTDEELAWELMLWRCEAVAKYHGVESVYPDTQKTICDWLKQPYKEATDD